MEDAYVNRRVIFEVDLKQVGHETVFTWFKKSGVMSYCV
jgi:hypothetical protein